MKVEKRRKMYVIFFSPLKAPLEHPRIPSPWTQPSSRGVMGVVVRLQAGPSGSPDQAVRKERTLGRLWEGLLRIVAEPYGAGS